jgi:hypothetical protein
LLLLERLQGRRLSCEPREGAVLGSRDETRLIYGVE